MGMGSTEQAVWLDCPAPIPPGMVPYLLYNMWLEAQLLCQECICGEDVTVGVDLMESISPFPQRRGHIIAGETQ